MADKTANDGSGLRKIVLRVTLVLGVLTLILCVVGWAFVGAPALDHTNRVVEFDASLPAAVGPAVWEHVERWEDTDADGELDLHTFVLVLGPRTTVDEDEIPALQDKFWKAYVLAFREGGMPVDELAVGEPGPTGALSSGVPNQGSVINWDENRISVEEIEKRTGIAAPPLSEFAKLQQAWGSSD